MKRRVSIAGMVPALAVALTMAACSHNKAQTEKSGEQQQAGQSQQGQQAPGSASAKGQTGQGQTGSAQASSSQQQQQLLGEQNVSTGESQIQRQKKVVSTVIVKEKIPTVKESTIRADINRMDAKQFAAIGFPRDVAQNIVQYRDRNGPFHSVNDLSNVDGVSRSMLDRFDGSLGVDQAQAGISGQGLSNQQDQSQAGQMQSGQAQSDHSQTEQYQSKDSQAGSQPDSSSSGWNQ